MPPAPSNRALETFIRAVEFAVMEQDPELAAGPLPLVADFFVGRALAAIGSVAEAHTFEILVGHLLLLERAAGRTTNKHLLLWQRPAEYKADGQAVTAIATYLRSTFGVNMEVVESPAAAGAYLVKAAND